jgi:hypothetical protein
MLSTACVTNRCNVLFNVQRLNSHTTLAPNIPQNTLPPPTPQVCLQKQNHRAIMYSMSGGCERSKAAADDSAAAFLGAAFCTSCCALRIHTLSACLSQA